MNYSLTFSACIPQAWNPFRALLKTAATFSEPSSAVYIVVNPLFGVMDQCDHIHFSFFKNAFQKVSLAKKPPPTTLVSNILALTLHCCHFAWTLGRRAGNK